MSRGSRLALFTAGPLVLICLAGYLYLTRVGHVSTQDAYVKADMVNITPEVSGRIVAVEVRENEQVRAGDVLFRIDDGTYRAGLARAHAGLAAARQRIDADKAEYRQKGEELALAREDVAYLTREQSRLTQLRRTQALAESELDEAKHEVTAARHRVRALQFEQQRLLARLSGDPDLRPEQHPDYQEAAAGRAVVAQALENCTVRAPFDGIASKVPDLGQYAAAGTPAMSLVSDTALWVEANFKETDLTHVRPGQRATLQVDTYPDRALEGIVESISQATGAEFSVLPPQNATGNWVKVVQRIPVRIRIVGNPAGTPLRAGMSTDVDIDTNTTPELKHARAGTP